MRHEKEHPVEHCTYWDDEVMSYKPYPPPKGWYIGRDRLSVSLRSGRILHLYRADCSDEWSRRAWMRREKPSLIRAMRMLNKAVELGWYA